jgi:hypothetical protein
MSDIPKIDPQLVDAWEKHEKIAMHFNDLIMKVRIQALGALAAIITIGGVALKAFPTDSGRMPWGIVLSLSITLLSLWVAIWVLDFMYYNRLLMGAVDAILKLEEEINNGSKIEIVMSHKIEDAVRGRPLTHLDKDTLKGPIIFYLIVSVLLSAGFLYSLFKYIYDICIS